MSQFMGTARIGNCYLDHETKPYYRNVKKRFMFYMNVTNALKPKGTYPGYVYPVKHYDIGKLSHKLVKLALGVLPSFVDSFNHCLKIITELNSGQIHVLHHYVFHT